VPEAALARATVPVAGVGLALALATGPALLTARAMEYAANQFLWAKFGAVAAGLVNLAALHRSAAWRDGGASRGGRRRLALAAATSLAACLAAVSAGRMIAYW
jgi:hypothetical protein